MATDPAARAVEVFSAPLGTVIAALGRAMGDAQRELDRDSADAEDAIAKDPVLSRLGTQATWYQVPHVDLELKLAVTMTEERRRAQRPPFPPGFFPGLPKTFVAQPVSAAFQNHFDYSPQAASVVRLSVVPVPTPRAGDPAVVSPRLDREEVASRALRARRADFATVIDAEGRKVPDPKLAFDVNFNAAARVWYVVQYDPADPYRTATVVSVDDASAAARVVT